MTLLAGVAYDPAAAVTKSTASLLAMTALDTTNLRVTFTCPSNGIVLVHLRGCTHGATTYPRILLGVLDGATVRGRMTPIGDFLTAVATAMIGQDASFLVTGLTAGQSYTWDAAYGVEILVASTGIKYGGPNDTAGNDAFGAFAFEVWSTERLLAGTMYDPGTAATLATTSLLAMTALDTTNLRLTFTAPNSGNVMWRIRTQFEGSTTYGQPLIGILEGATVVSRVAPVKAHPGTNLATTATPYEATGVVTGVSAGSHTWDAAYAVQTVAAAGGIKYGGPNNTTTDDAWGGTAFEIWAA